MVVCGTLQLTWDGNMAEIVQGLFGVSPEQLNAQRQQAMQKQAMDYSQLNPFQRATYGIGMGAQQLGTAVGGMLGGVDPEMAKIQQRKQLLQGLDITNPASLREKAMAFMQANDYQAAQELSNKAAELEKTATEKSKQEAITLKDLAAAKHYGVTADKSVAAERSRNTIRDLEVKLSNNETLTAPELAGARWLLAQESKPRTFQDPQTNQLITIPGLNIEEAAPNLAKLLAGEKGAQPPAAGVTGAVGGIKVTETPSSLAKQAVAEIDKAKAVDYLQNTVSEYAGTKQTIKDTIEAVSPWTAGYGSLLSILPTSDALTVSTNLGTIKAAFGADKIKEMKLQSKTGATGYGSLAVKELEGIQATVASLDPKMKPADLKKNLQKINDHYTKWEELVGRDISRTQATPTVVETSKPSYVPPTKQVAAPAPAASSMTRSREDVISKTMSANPGKSREAVEAALKAQKIIQ